MTTTGTTIGTTTGTTTGTTIGTTTETTIETGLVAVEACPEFRATGHDPLVCACGWLEDDHGELAVARLARLRGRVAAPVPARRAS